MSWDIHLVARVGTLDIDVRFEIGRVGAIVGPNGSGKTTILRMLTGTMNPNAGHVRVDGNILFDASRGITVPPEERGLGYVPQGFALFPHLSVLDNVAFGLPRSMPRDQRWTRARALLEELGAGELAHRNPRRLSGGEQQRVALARAMAIRPRGMLLDEPMSALDASSRRAMRSFLVGHLEKHDCPALIVTHDARDVAALRSEVVVIDNGRVVQRGTREALSANPVNDFVAELFE